MKEHIATLPNCVDVTSQQSPVALIPAETFRHQHANELRRRIAYHEAAHAFACLCLGIPIVDVSIDSDTPRLYRDRYRPPDGVIGLQAMCILCLSGGVGESIYFGSVTDRSDERDIEQCRDYLRHAGCGPVAVGMGLQQARDAAHRLVTTEFARRKIPIIAHALMVRGSLTGEQINEL